MTKYSTNLIINVEKYSDVSLKITVTNGTLKQYNEILRKICGMTYNSRLQNGPGYISSITNKDTITTVINAIINNVINPTMTVQQVITKLNLNITEEQKKPDSSTLENKLNEIIDLLNQLISVMNVDPELNEFCEKAKTLTPIEHARLIGMNVAESDDTSLRFEKVEQQSPPPPPPLPVVPVVNTFLSFYNDGIKNASSARILNVNENMINITFDDIHMLTANKEAENIWKIIGYELPHHLTYD